MDVKEIISTVNQRFCVLYLTVESGRIDEVVIRPSTKVGSDESRYPTQLIAGAPHVARFNLTLIPGSTFIFAGSVSSIVCVIMPPAQ